MSGLYGLYALCCVIATGLFAYLLYAMFRAEEF